MWEVCPRHGVKLPAGQPDLPTGNYLRTEADDCPHPKYGAFSGFSVPPRNIFPIPAEFPLVGRYCVKALCRHGENRSRSEEHTSELQSQFHLVCRLLLEKNICLKNLCTTCSACTTTTLCGPGFFFD